MPIAVPAPSTRQALALLLALALALLAATWLPDLAAAAATNPLEKGAENATSTARAVLGAAFTILLGFVAIRLFAQRNYGGLAVALVVGGVVAWVVFDPAGAGDTLKNIGSSLVGD